MDVEFAQWIGTLGVGGVLAALMFHFYRQDVRQYTDLWKGQSEVLMNVVKENTASNVRLIGVIESMQVTHARVMRRLDGEDDRQPERKSRS